VAGLSGNAQRLAVEMGAVPMATARADEEFR
jgi:hypothetical protein